MATTEECDRPPTNIYGSKQPGPQISEFHSAREQRIAQHRTRLQDYESFCGGLGEKPADVALAWLLAQPGVAAPVTGPRTREQLDGSLRALEITMAPEILKKLYQLFPGPGGPAPETYTWD